MAILEIVARQPDLLSRAGVQRCRGRQQTCRWSYDKACRVITLLVTPNPPSSWRLVQAHVHPNAVLLVPRLVGIPGALLQEGVCDLVVNVLLEHVLVRELHMAVEVVQPGRLASG